MPRVSRCTFKNCALGLKKSDLEDFTSKEMLHWKSCHVDEPVVFVCPFTNQRVRIRRDPNQGYTFPCVCGQKMLYRMSVKKHYFHCLSVRVLLAEDAQAEPYMPSSPQYATNVSNAGERIRTRTDTDASPSTTSEQRHVIQPDESRRYLRSEAMNGLPPENNPKSHPKPPSSTQQQPPKIHVAPSTVDESHDPLPQTGKDQPLQPAGPSVDTRDDSPSIPSESGPPHLDNEALQYLNRIACSMEEIQVEMAAMTGELRGLLRRWGVASSTKK